MTASPGRNSSQDMAMGMVHVDDIKLLTTKIVGDVEDVPKITPQKLRMISPDGMVQAKLVRRLHACKPNPFLYTILNREGRFLIGQSNLVPSLF
jgi:hypothetical protein